jgi:hypothetical protein
MNWIHLTQDTDQWMSIRVPKKCSEILKFCSNERLAASKEDLRPMELVPQFGSVTRLLEHLNKIP